MLVATSIIKLVFFIGIFIEVSLRRNSIACTIILIGKGLGWQIFISSFFDSKFTIPTYLPLVIITVNIHWVKPVLLSPLPQHEDVEVVAH
uniref:Uncharacterized protein n=1 Tax=Arundo donax TaxID=35708 RepID=A0A0A9E4P2_ARUDO